MIKSIEARKYRGKLLVSSVFFRLIISLILIIVS